MAGQVSIIMYHYVRDLRASRYPSLKALDVKEFEGQLKYLQRHYRIVTVQECLDSIYDNAPIPPNAALLTFDDAYSEHYDYIFPLLEKNGVQGCFFAPVKTIEENSVLDVNKIHFILASIKDIGQIHDDIRNLLGEYRFRYDLKSFDEYYRSIQNDSRYDTQEVVFVKRLLQRELDPDIRKLFTKYLFEKHVTKDESSFSKELYMSKVQLREMAQAGMCIGSHGYDHLWLNSLVPADQEIEIDRSLEFLADLGVSADNWVMCYPYGGYNDSLVEIVRKKGCGMGLTINKGIAQLNAENACILERLDTNDLPKSAGAEPNEWTKKTVR